MNKKVESDKKKKISVSINSDLYKLIEKDIKDNKIKKSQIIEKALKEYKEYIDNANITELDIFNLINKLKNNDTMNE